jgi:5-methylcytosine-specific restriction enzyme subunit McrC
LFSPTLHELPRRNGKTVCAFDDLSHDILTNQIIKATALHLLRSAELSVENRAGLTDVVRRLGRVTERDITSALFRRVQLHRNNAFYGFLVDVCAIIHENLLPRDTEGQTTFRDFTRDETKMAMLFQHFLKNFFNKEQRSFKIGSPRMRWSATGTAGDLRLLPEMQTDIVAWNTDSCVVIDAKYYEEPVQSSQYKATVHSSHLYQLYAYLRHISSRFPQSRSVSGMLVYPGFNRSLDLRYSIDGYGVHVRTLDLNQPWQCVHRDALEMLRSVT